MARPDFIKLWGGSRPSIPAIGSVDYAGGWLAYLGTTPPSTDDHDYVMNLQDQRAIWLGEQALMSVGHEWQSDVSYDDDAYVRPVGGGPLYRSLNAVNLNNEPTASPAFWKLVEIGIVPTASTTVRGGVFLADNTETQTGTDAGKAVTAAGLASVTATETRKGLIEKATTGEAAAGTDTERAVTPAGLAARESGRRYTSADLTITLGSSISLTHGLGVSPWDVSARLVCAVAEHGYSVGAVVDVSAFQAGTAGSAASALAAMQLTSTQVIVQFGTERAFVPQIGGGTPGARAEITVANWKLRVRAQA